MRVAFIGVGNMGAGMARNLIKAGHAVTAFDLDAAKAQAVAAAGGRAAASAREAVAEAEAVVTMLPAGRHVLALYRGEVFGRAPKGALLIDCSTIDVDSARTAATEAAAAGYSMLDAPVSGGVKGAEAGTLAFMAGGEAEAFARAKPLLEAMGKKIVHCGASGAGQAAKICNNLMLGIQMISVAEGFVLAEKLGLNPQTLFDVSSNASGQCWSLTSYCPIPGVGPQSPADNDYKPGFAAMLMRKDLGLALESAARAGARLDLGTAALSAYDDMCAAGESDVDFSGIIRRIRAASA